ncbi:RNB domain-containing ribonuclease [Cellulomonas carbonis]|uniref:Ribonuclease II n=1 Tax=Cellulomonas carbonis T26 TaxID=947969 RepID=A0A0A0BSU5_9CELL|nr:RNB domain-containing ribonuclease [Cellulomonas carbonis]KGM11031.1 ribonuclease II [Cellulomonas carbonis T26]GGB99598.1 ribonuclease R [Cellulomonas carbonis]
MPTRVRTLRTAEPAPARPDVVERAPFDRALEAIRSELELPTVFPAAVLAEAERAVREPDLPSADRTDVPLVTVDPPGATDLDQALHVERRGTGFRVHYAIADVPAFVVEGGAVDDEARRRGQTMYAPDTRVPLHPPVLSEGAASLLPGQEAPAFLWTFDLDDTGATTAVRLERAMVRSRAQLDYEGVQHAVDSGTADEVLLGLRDVGLLRIEQERARGGAALPIPDQEVVVHPDGYELRLRPPLPSEDWNAQLSLMTGMAAAQIMLGGRVGLLRTMPPPDPRDVAAFRRQALALGVDWPDGARHGDVLRSLDARDPRHLALLHGSTALFRGAGYTAVDGELPEVVEQAAVAAPYAHVTAPLRRLVDRFGLVACEALHRGAEVPAWVREALPSLPEVMTGSDRRAGALERAVVDAAEAALLAGRVGQVVAAVVVDVDERRPQGRVQVTDPPVLAPFEGRAELGARVQVRLVEADPVARRVLFVIA